MTEPAIIEVLVPGEPQIIEVVQAGSPGAPAAQDLVLSFSGSYEPGALEAFWRAGGQQVFDPAHCTCEGAHGGLGDLVWTMTLNAAPFATFTVHPDATGTVAFQAGPVIPAGALVRVTAPAEAEATFSSFTVTLRS